MKIFAVAFITFFDNELTTEFIQAEDWLSAAKQHSKASEYDFDYNESYASLDRDRVPASDLEKLKQHFFDQDAMIDVKELP